MRFQEKTPIFYTLICLAGTLIILFPVGIANLVMGYIMGDSPCSSCWGQRESMIFIGAMALFIARFGLKPKYLALMLMMVAFGLWQSFNHLGWHSGSDLDQGFSLMIFGLHTYAWAEIIFWCVIVFLGIMMLFVSKFSDIEKNQNNLSSPQKFAFYACIFVVASNVFQAFVSTGVPPFLGQSDPVRFSLNPQTTIWSTHGWKKFFSSFSFIGNRNVKSPDYAFSPATQLPINFDHNPLHSPFASISSELKIIQTKQIPLSQPLNTLSKIDGEYVVSSKNEVYFLDNDFHMLSSFKIDPYFSATINPIVGVIALPDHRYMLMGSNKTYLRFQKNSNADKNLQYADFIQGADQFEGQGHEGLGRGRFFTIRAKLNHALSLAIGDKYIYTATVPNNQDQKNFIISAFLQSDLKLSREFTPHANLKENRNLGNLYITAMQFNDHKLYALSKNFNIIAVINPDDEKIIKTISYPSNITNARGFLIQEDGSIAILSYQDGKNMLFILK